MGCVMIAYKLFTWSVVVFFATGTNLEACSFSPIIDKVAMPPAEAYKMSAEAGMQSSGEIAIHAQAPDQPAVEAIMSEQAQAVLSYLLQAGGQHTYAQMVSLEPELQKTPGQPNQITGYSGWISVIFSTAPGRIHELLTGSLAAVHPPAPAFPGVGKTEAVVGVHAYARIIPED